MPKQIIAKSHQQPNIPETTIKVWGSETHTKVGDAVKHSFTKPMGEKIVGRNNDKPKLLSLSISINPPPKKNDAQI